MPPLMDITGQRFGRLVVIKRNGYRARRTAWLCKCDCGKYVTATQNCLARGRTKSCGCLNDELRAQRASKAGKARGKQLTKHGHASERLYGVWKSMRGRCNTSTDSDYKDYGGRGIKICAEWDDYTVFREWALANGYDPNAPFGITTIDRIDVNGDYCPSNCRFVDLKQQAQNRRPRRRKSCPNTN